VRLRASLGRVAAGLLSVCASTLVALAAAPASVARAALPRPAHIVVIVEENRSFDQIVGVRAAPYINRLIRAGALFVDAHGVTHPSLPNYFALFAGLTNGNGDGCPATGISSEAPNVASELIAAHRSFAAYSESLPSTGFDGCAAGTYARKHAPWVHFKNVPASDSLPLSKLPAFDRLPDVAYVVPNVDDDMHDRGVADGDAWLRAHAEPLVAWAQAHDALLILTWDEGFDASNHVATLFVGPMIRSGRYTEHVTHYRVLRTIEALEGLAPTGHAADVSPIADVWR
jgi:hypothetical protein